MSKYWQIASPITCHVETTTRCNFSCRHCYNFNRKPDFKSEDITWNNLKNTIDELIKNECMHILPTGGEPLYTMDKTCYLIKNCIDAGMTTSLNSNLSLMTPRKAKQLKDAGLTHILTTLHSYKSEVHDFVASTNGAFNQIVNGIKIAQENGIRVTVNTILFQFNKNDIYETGRFVKSLGVKKFLCNRTIPSPTNDESLKKEFNISIEDIQKMFKDLLRLKNEESMEIGTCRTVPQCVFNDLDENDEFLARGCAAGKKHLLLKVNGDASACVHESKTYGNIHKIGLKQIWKNMSEWRTMKYIPKECQSCHLFNICDGGCRLVAQYYTHTLSGCDNLRRGAEHLPNYNGGITKEHIRLAKNGVFKVHPDFSFRKEKDFYIVRILGARVDFIDTKECNELIRYHKKFQSFTFDDTRNLTIEKLAYYIKRNLVIPIEN